MSQPQIATPLRAEHCIESPSWCLIDANGIVIADRLTKETAAAIVEIVNGQAGLLPELGKLNESIHKMMVQQDAIEKKFKEFTDVANAALTAGGDAQ